MNTGVTAGYIYIYIYIITINQQSMLKLFIFFLNKLFHDYSIVSRKLKLRIPKSIWRFMMYENCKLKHEYFFKATVDDSLGGTCFGDGIC